MYKTYSRCQDVKLIQECQESPQAFWCTRQLPVGRDVLAYDFAPNVLYPHASTDLFCSYVPAAVSVALVQAPAHRWQEDALTDDWFSAKQAAFLQVQLLGFKVCSADHSFERWTLHAFVTPAPPRALFQSPTNARLLRVLLNPSLLAQAAAPHVS